MTKIIFFHTFLNNVTKYFKKRAIFSQVSLRLNKKHTKQQGNTKQKSQPFRQRQNTLLFYFENSHKKTPGQISRRLNTKRILNYPSKKGKIFRPFYLSISI